MDGRGNAYGGAPLVELERGGDAAAEYAAAAAVDPIPISRSRSIRAAVILLTRGAASFINCRRRSRPLHPHRPRDAILRLPHRRCRHAYPSHGGAGKPGGGDAGDLDHGDYLAPLRTDRMGSYLDPIQSDLISS